MVEIIGLGTMAGLVWLLAWAMGGEADSERKRATRGQSYAAHAAQAGQQAARHAA